MSDNDDCHFAGTTAEWDYGKHRLKRCVLRRLWKTARDGADVTWCGKPFQTRAAATEKARSPMVTGSTPPPEMLPKPPNRLVRGTPLPNSHPLTMSDHLTPHFNEPLSNSAMDNGLCFRRRCVSYLVSLSVCLLARLRKSYSTDVHKIR